MKWTQARNSVSGDYPVIEIEDENGVTVADAYEHAGLIEAAPDMSEFIRDLFCYLDDQDDTYLDTGAPEWNRICQRGRDSFAKTVMKKAGV